MSTNDRFNLTIKTIEETIDFEGRFKDVNAQCMSAEQVAEILNTELKRIRTNEDLKPKDRVMMNPLATRFSKGMLGNYEDTDLPMGFDMQKFIDDLTDLPNGGIFGSSNEKIEKSKNKNFSTIHTGIPAVSALVYDTDAEKFYALNTCPAAGQCIKYCYARKGFFALQDGTITNLLRRINLLLNHPEEYEELAYEELSLMARRANWAGKQLRIRWNDSGDFFSEEYFNIADRVTNRLIKRGRDVRSYAYTKIAKYVNKSRKDFIINFSEEAKTSEKEQVDLSEVKLSKVVPAHVFKSHKEGRNIIKSQELKKSISDHYGIDIERLKYNEELPEVEGDRHQYDAIITNKDTDVAAQRDDVRVSFLLIH